MAGTPSPDDEAANAHFLRLAPLLRVWRADAGRRLGQRKALPQSVVAERAGMSERWYRKLESGEAVPQDSEDLDLLADALLLDRADRAVLYLRAARSLPVPPAESGSDSPPHGLRLLLDRQIDPAFLTNGAWDILGYNNLMGGWFPWVEQRGANLVRWALSAPAREQILDWPTHARGFLSMLRFALTAHPHDARLTGLLADTLRDPYCQHVWNERPDFAESLDGHRFRLSLPSQGTEIITVLAHLLHPGTHPTHRLAVLTPLPEETGSESLP